MVCLSACRSHSLALRHGMAIILEEQYASKRFYMCSMHSTNQHPRYEGCPYHVWVLMTFSRSCRWHLRRHSSKFHECERCSAGPFMLRRRVPRATCMDCGLDLLALFNVALGESTCIVRIFKWCVCNRNNNCHDTWLLVWPGPAAMA